MECARDLRAHHAIDCAIGDTIRIGDGIVVRIIETPGQSAKVGIAAPRSMRVIRKELIEIKKKPPSEGRLG